MNQMLRAFNRTRNPVLCARLEDAGGLRGQSRGLLGRDHLDTDHGMLFIDGPFAPFMWMHMFFMKFAINIVFLDKNNRVIKIGRMLKPWRVSSVVFGARKAIELAAGAASRGATERIDQIEIAEIQHEP
jgi:uncharacterized protein